MKEKPRIFKAENGWAVELPGFGFHAGRQVKGGFSSHQEAGKWLERYTSHSPSGGSFDRVETPDGCYLGCESWPTIIR